MNILTFRALSVALCAAFVAGCGGTGAGVASSGVPGQRQDTVLRAQAKLVRNVAFAIVIRPSVGKRRTPRYVSPSTKSVDISTDGTLTSVVEVTPTAPNCAAGTQPGSYLCTGSLSVPSGNHVFTVTAYDYPYGEGDVLSTNSTGPVYVRPIGVTTIPLVLEGVVQYVVLTLTTAYPTIGKATTIGLTPLVFDADDNLIVGPARFENPVTLTTTDSADGPLSRTVLNSPADTAGITATYNGAIVPSITYSATAAGVPSANVTNFVLTSSSVDASTHLYVANQLSNTISVFDLAHPAAAPASLSGGGLFDASGLAFDASGKLYVSNANNSISVFDTAHGNAALSKITGGMSEPAGMVVDASGRLYVANVSGSSVSVFDTTHQNAALPTITGGGLTAPQAVALGQDGRLYVANQDLNASEGGVGGNGNVVVFDTAHGNAVLSPIAGGDLSNPAAAALAVNGKLYVANESFGLGADADIVSIFDTERGNAPLPGIPSNGDQSFGVALDASGKLYVANFSTNSIDVYDIAHGNAQLPTISGGPAGSGVLNGPGALAVH